MLSSLQNEIVEFENFLIKNKNKFYEKKVGYRYLEILFKIYEIQDKEEYKIYREMLRGVIDRNWSDTKWGKRQNAIGVESIR